MIEGHVRVDGAGGSASGACLCGGVAYTGRLKHGRAFDVCHCGMCRRWAGGPWFGVALDGFSVTQPKNLGAFRSSEWAERLFCTSCGGALGYRLVGRDHVSVALGTIEGADEFTFLEQIFVDHKPANYAFADNTPMKTEAECISAFTAEYMGSEDG